MVAYGFTDVEWPGRDKVFYMVAATVFIPYPALIIALFDILAAEVGQYLLPADRAVLLLFHPRAVLDFLIHQFFDADSAGTL